MWLARRVVTSGSQAASLGRAPLIWQHASTRSLSTSTRPALSASPASAAASSSSSAAQASSSLAPTNIQTPFPFDKYRLVQRLEAAGLSVSQSEAVMSSLNEIITESISTLEKRVILKTEQERHVYAYKADFAELKSELHMIEQNDFAILKGENERLLTELSAVRSALGEEVAKLKSSVHKELEQEKQRILLEANEQEHKISSTDHKIDTEIANMRTYLETIKLDIVRAIVGALFSVAALALGYWRLVAGSGPSKPATPATGSESA